MAVFEVNFMASSLNRTVPMNIIIPTDKIYLPGMQKREEGKPYKTLYLLHGVLGNYMDWLYGTRIQRWAEELDLAVVNVEHTFEVGEGSHEWDFWDTYIKKVMEWLPLEGAASGIGSGNIGK